MKEQQRRQEWLRRRIKRGELTRRRYGNKKRHAGKNRSRKRRCDEERKKRREERKRPDEKMKPEDKKRLEDMKKSVNKSTTQGAKSVLITRDKMSIGDTQMSPPDLRTRTQNGPMKDRTTLIHSTPITQGIQSKLDSGIHCKIVIADMMIEDQHPSMKVLIRILEMRSLKQIRRMTTIQDTLTIVDNQANLTPEEMFVISMDILTILLGSIAIIKVSHHVKKNEKASLRRNLMKDPLQAITTGVSTGALRKLFPRKECHLEAHVIRHLVTNPTMRRSTRSLSWTLTLLRC